MPVFVRTVTLHNYKSIGTCKVNMQSLTLLVGPNGAGKSNFIDSLRLVTESLRTSLEHALRERGGIKEVRRSSRGHPRHFGIRLDLLLPNGVDAWYGFEVGALPNGAFRVRHEECHVFKVVEQSSESFFIVEDGELKQSSPGMPSKIEPDRLYLTVVSALSEFRAVYDSLSNMGFYSLNPDRIRDLQSPDAGELLKRDGSNISSVLSRLIAAGPGPLKRIEEYLAAVVPGVESVKPRVLGPRETLAFKQTMVGDTNPWEFMASSMSDGTLRVLGVLVAVFQASGESQRPIPLVGIEEPELALHPGATMVLLEALLEASQRTQIVLTTHSPDLLDNRSIKAESILSVTSGRGQTRIAPVDKASRDSIVDGLYSPGELLRLGQIEPDEEALQETDKQVNLFRCTTLHASPHNSHR